MASIIYFILGFILASGIIYLIMRRMRKEGAIVGEGNKVINPEQIKKHKENLGQIGGWLASRGQITNNDVEKLLGVSNATAERYLNELEKQGTIVQVGRTGQSVYYKLK